MIQATKLNKRLKPTSTALLVLRFNATLAQNNQLRSGGLAGRYVPNEIVVMKYRKYALPAYVIYLLSYLSIIAVSISIDGWGFSSESLIEIAQFILLPIPVCLAIGFTVWLFKRRSLISYSMASMVFVSPLGVVINLLAAYLLWWSASNA